MLKGAFETMLKNLRKGKEGFTIIEVLIVLAIAGLIMLIVFLAVPALQRNSRNTQRRNDVANLLGAVSEYVNNNGGKVPNDGPTLATAVDNAKLGFYDTTKVDHKNAAADVANPNDIEFIFYSNGTKCELSGGVPTGDATNVGASARQYTALYTVETGGTQQPLCQES